ncbi:hypothetical protein LG3211_3485 [Lysobacter gummosus]|nr:hypothetical protein LG3211_3485 [Lysobacter gummosus]
MLERPAIRFRFHLDGLDAIGANAPCIDDRSRRARSPLASSTPRIEREENSAVWPRG